MNLQNNDKMWFKYSNSSVLTGHMDIRLENRIDPLYNNIKNKYNFLQMSYPVPLKDISQTF